MTELLIAGAVFGAFVFCAAWEGRRERNAALAGCCLTCRQAKLPLIHGECWECRR